MGHAASQRFLTTSELGALARGESIAGDAMDTYAQVHQSVADVASQIPIASGFVPIVNLAWTAATGRAGTTAEQQKRDAAAAAKAAADAQRAATYPQTQAAAEAAASAAGTQRIAEAATADAATAATAAKAEANQSGPLHQAAAKKAAYAKMMWQSVADAEAKAAAAQALVPTVSSPLTTAKTPTATPWWKSNAAIAGAVAVSGVAVLLLAMRASRKR